MIKKSWEKIIFQIFFLTINPFSCLTYDKIPRTNANPDERLLDMIVWRHSKASGKTHHVLVINITSSGTYRAQSECATEEKYYFGFDSGKKCEF